MSWEVNGEGLPGFGNPAENHGVDGGMLSYDREGSRLPLYPFCLLKKRIKYPHAFFNRRRE